MTAPPLAVELFSGTAGATAAFRRAGWRVVTVDLDARHRPSIVADVRALPLMLGPDRYDPPIPLEWQPRPQLQATVDAERVDGDDDLAGDGFGGVGQDDAHYDDEHDPENSIE